MVGPDPIWSIIFVVIVDVFFIFIFFGNIFDDFNCVKKCVCMWVVVQ